MCEQIMLTVKRLMIVLFLVAWLPSISWAGGWYLMVAPPKVSKDERGPSLLSPLKFWDQRKSFDSARSCEEARMRELASYATRVASASVTPDKITSEDEMNTLVNATELWLLGGDSTKIPPHLLGPISRAVLDFKPGYLCIATDDPRLK